MVAKSGDRLLRPDAVLSLKERLLPLADLVTPNLPEAGDLLGREPPDDAAGMIAAAAALRALGPRAVLVKGGHGAAADSIDVLDDGGEPLVLVAPPPRDRQHPWHRLHAVRGDRGAAGAGAAAARGGRGRQGLSHRARSPRRTS